ncbi:hypothetical protein ABIA39_001076 [Nocardia sp. GAS34]
MDAFRLDQYTTCPAGAGGALPMRNPLPHAMAAALRLLERQRRCGRALVLRQDCERV